MSDPLNPFVLGTAGTGFGSDIALTGHRAYTANGANGLRITDIQNFSDAPWRVMGAMPSTAHLNDIWGTSPDNVYFAGGDWTDCEGICTPLPEGIVYHFDDAQWQESLRVTSNIGG